MGAFYCQPQSRPVFFARMAVDAVGRSILKRVEFTFARHSDSKRPQRVKDFD
jgi:hypothetical protein